MTETLAPEPRPCCAATGHAHRPEVFTPEDVAAYLQCSLSHLNDIRREDPTFPQPRMLATLPRWTRQAVHNWVHTASHPAPTAAETAAPQPAATRRRAAGAAKPPAPKPAHHL